MNYEIFYLKKDENSKDLKDFLTKQKAKILTEKEPRKTRFTYPIKKENVGFTGSFIFQMDPDGIKELIKEINLSNFLLRYMITKIDLSKNKTEDQGDVSGKRFERQQEKDRSSVQKSHQDYDKKELSNEALEKKIEEISG